MPKIPKNSNAISQVFHVAPETAASTLAAALHRWLPQRSWSEVRRLIESRHVLVNGNLCLDAGRRLQPQEVVKLLPHPAAALPKEHDVRVQYLDEHLVVVEKPAGMTTNRHREEKRWSKPLRQLQPTLDELLPQIIAKIEGRRGKPGVLPPVRAVHRLDRETSGLIVFARTHEAERILAQQFRKHTTHRRYVAIVAGQVKAQTITSQLVRDRGDGRRGSTKEPGVGKTAVTYVKPLEGFRVQGSGVRVQGSAEGEKGSRGVGELRQRESLPFSPSPLHPFTPSPVHPFTPSDAKADRRQQAASGASYTLIQCRLETGRTHQIRIHFSEAGHPVCGDKLYCGPPFQPPLPDNSGAPRLALHAAELGFVHPLTGKTLRFQSPLPSELAELWQRLKGK